MVEPKIEKTEKPKPKTGENAPNPEAEQSKAPNTEAVNKYWSYVQSTRMLEVPKIAVFSGEGGLILVPLDRIGRVLLDSTLFLPIETLDKLAEAMSNFAGESKE
jgi:hypothetical protein